MDRVLTATTNAQTRARSCKTNQTLRVFSKIDIISEVAGIWYCCQQSCGGAQFQLPPTATDALIVLPYNHVSLVSISSVTLNLAGTEIQHIFTAAQELAKQVLLLLVGLLFDSDRLNVKHTKDSGSSQCTYNSLCTIDNSFILLRVLHPLVNNVRRRLEYSIFNQERKTVQILCVLINACIIKSLHLCI